ncbi:MAG: DUF6273 domain-containing protein [Bacilli bacterium]|nr:DUF6273 domain-containing protein [Bacilli bacterium]
MKKKLILLLAPMMLLSCGGSKPEPTYTITFNCTDCRAYDESDNEVTSVTVPAVDPTLSLYKEFHFEGNKPFKVPLKSDIAIKKTGTEEIVKHKYVNGTISVPIVGNLTVTAIGSSYSKDLETSSWDEIAEISATGRADEFFKVGDTKAVTLKGQSFAHTVRIIDFNHDDLADGSGKAGITFEFANVITKDDKTNVYTTIWDGEYIVSGDNFDYRQSVLNTFLNDETEGTVSVINMLPDDLSKEGIIKPVNKLVGVSTDEGQNYIATPFEEDKCPKLFPLAYNELHNLEGTKPYVTPGEAGNPATGGGIYKYYEGHGGDAAEDKAYRVKKKVDGNTGEIYWLRSPYTENDTYAWYVYKEGYFDNYAVFYNTRPVAPAFCI